MPAKYNSSIIFRCPFYPPWASLRPSIKDKCQSKNRDEQDTEVLELQKCDHDGLRGSAPSSNFGGLLIARSFRQTTKSQDDFYLIQRK